MTEAYSNEFLRRLLARKQAENDELRQKLLKTQAENDAMKAQLVAAALRSVG